MTFSRPALAGLLAFIATISASPAQDEVPKQRVSFFAFDVPAERTSVHLMTPKNGFLKLGLPGANATAPQTLANLDGHITIHDQPVAGPDGKMTYPVLGKIKSSPQWPEVMVILIAEKKGDKDQFTGFAFPMSKTDLPPGSIKFANLSPHVVRGLLGSSKVIFKPGVIETIKLKEKAGSMINVIFQYQEGETWQRMMATQWAVGSQERILVFAFKSPLSGTMTSRSIPLRDD
jgi:hypothetical protein